MKRRWLSIWLPDWPIERMAAVAKRRAEPFPIERPLALLALDQGVPRLAALNRPARALRLKAGMTLADARAAHPPLETREAEPEADAEALASTALWCGRWSPRTAPDGADGIALDITGCAHLFGGEEALLREVETRIAGLGFTCRAAIADRLLAAWAWARFGTGGVLPAPEATVCLRELPVAALRIDPEVAAALARLGLGEVGRVAALPRASLLGRFGPEVPHRLDQMLGGADWPFVPLAEPRRFTVRMAFAEPIGRTEDVEAAARRLLWQLCGELERARLGVRGLRLGLHRVDGRVVACEIGLGQPSRDARHLGRLLAMRLDGLDAGFGVELVFVEALETAPLEAEQAGLADAADSSELARLADQLALRLGQERVVRLAPTHSHLPERAVRTLPITAGAVPEMPRLPMARPLRLWERPRELQVVAAVPDGRPLRLRGGRSRPRVTAALGPERILPEWWDPADDAARPRDYWRAALEDGRLLWVYREGAYDDTRPPVWRLHGSFG